MANSDFLTKILFIIPQLNAGGTESHLVKLCLGLKAKGIISTVITFGNGDEYSNNARTLSNADIQVYFAHSILRTKFSFVKFLYILRKENAKIVHSFYYGPNFIDVIIFLISKAKNFVIEKRNLQHWRTNKFLTLGERFRNKMASTIVANSYAVRDVSIKTELININKFRIIRNGVDMQKRRTVIRQFGIHEENGKPVKILCVSNIKLIKRQKDIVQAVIKLIRQNPKIKLKLQLVGRLDDEYAESLKTSVAAGGFSDYIELHGQVENVRSFYQNADIFVLCSQAEGLSNALLEAQSYGIPTICSDIIPNQSVVVNGVNGVTYPVGDVSGLQQALQRLLFDLDLRKRYSNCAFNLVKKFDVNCMIEEYARVYDCYCDCD